MHPVCAWIKLFKRHAILKGLDGNVFRQVRACFVDKGHNCGVKFVFNRKHGVTVTGKVRGVSRSFLPSAETRHYNDACVMWAGLTRLQCYTPTRYLRKGCNLRALCLSLVLALAGCFQTPQPSAPSPQLPPGFDATLAARNFVTVVNRVEPVAERECRERLKNSNCDFQIVVDDRPNQPPNAFQTVDRNGRPIIAFTLALIADARSQDELAFILGHEAAHHIENHLPKTQTSAKAGALILGRLAELGGSSDAAIQTAARLGAAVGARRFSKEFELEADALGTIIAFRAGYDPVAGAAFFNRIPDPGDAFLGSHPPNAQRIETVKRVRATLR